jgi:transcriptional regulator with XRE-family HTH domain
MDYDAYEIGLRAYNVRLSLSKKQSDVSEKLNISQSTYSRFESGKYDMPLSQVIKLCNYLGVSVSWLIGEQTLPQLTSSESLEIEKFTRYLIEKREK